MADFSSARAAAAWRRRLARSAREVPGLRWIKAMSTLGDARRGGFAVGAPRPARQFAIAAWESQDAAAELAAELDARCSRHWHVLLAPVRTRGSFHGETPFGEARGEAPPDEPMAVLTLGRCDWRRLPRFTRRGAALTESTLGADGLITALTAGFPVSGNATFSLWEGAAQMQEFVYAKGAEHRGVIDTDKTKGILAEQISVRFRPLGISGTWDPETTPGAGSLSRLAARLA